MQSKKQEEHFDSDQDGDSEGDMDDEEGPKRRRPRVECIMGDRTAEELRNHHPQRITADFKWGARTVVLTSDFDAGNMCRAEQADCPNHFNIWMSSDSMPYYKYTGFRAWFYFGVKGVERGKNVHFHIRNMSFQRSLYSSGLRPFFRVGTEGKFKRIPGKLTWNNGEDGFQVNFTHQITVKDPETLTYFSFIEPWGYEDTIRYFSNWEEKIKNSPRMSDEVYFHRELLGYSLEKRYMELITITGRDDEVTERENKIEGKGLFPEFSDDSPEAKIFSRERCLKFDNKKVVFFCARVHPGEVQASHVLNGIVDFILSKSQQASILLENYVIKIIPLVNPDGVSRGYYRLDTGNHNLNRFYLNPCPNFQPTVYQVKKAIVASHKLGNLKLYIDLHGHASKKGCFIFGNNLKGEQQAENMLFAKLISLNSLNFDFQECSFSEKLMTAKDGGSGLSREGSGRVGIFKATGMVNSYTLECHYQTGRRINTLTPKYNLDQLCIESEDQLTDRNSKFYRDQRTPNYTVEIFEDVGRSVCIAMLEWIEKNPISRIPTSHYKNLASIRNEIIVHNCLLPYDVMKELRKEVTKEREQMKARTQKLQAQIQSKKLQEEKKAAKQKDREEREARAEIQEKLKQEHKEQKRRDSKKPPNLKRKNSNNGELKEEEKHQGNVPKNGAKGHLKQLNTKSPSDRFFAKIGSDILSPVTSKNKQGLGQRNQLAKQCNQSERQQSTDSHMEKQNVSPKKQKDSDQTVTMASFKDRRIESIPRVDPRRPTSNSSILNEKSKSAKSASRKQINKHMMQNMYKTDNEQNNQFFKGRNKIKASIISRQRSNLSCNDKDKGAAARDQSLNQQQQDQQNQLNTSQERDNIPGSIQNVTNNENGLTLFQQYVQKRSNIQGQMQQGQSQKINIDFLQKMGIPIPKEGEMIIIQYNDQIHCIDRRKPEERNKNPPLISQIQQQIQQKQNQVGFLVPDVIQGQLNNPKQMPKFIGGTQFGLSIDQKIEDQRITLKNQKEMKYKVGSPSMEYLDNSQLPSVTDDLKKDSVSVKNEHVDQRLNEQQQPAAFRNDMKNVFKSGNLDVTQFQKLTTTYPTQQHSTRDRINSQDKKKLPEIMEQNLENSLYVKRPNQVFARGVKPLLRKLQKTHVPKNIRFGGKPAQSLQRHQASSSNSRFNENHTQPELQTMQKQSHQDTGSKRKVSNSVEIQGQQQNEENVQFLNLLEQKSKIMEQLKQSENMGKQAPSSAELCQNPLLGSNQLRVNGQGNKNSQQEMLNTLQLKSAYNQNLFQGKMRGVNMVQHRPFQDFTQYINRHASPGRQNHELMPQIMAQNYRKMMKYNKQQMGSITNGQINTGGVEHQSQQLLLQSIDTSKMDNEEIQPDFRQSNIFNNKKLQNGQQAQQQRSECSPESHSYDFKSQTINAAGKNLQVNSNPGAIIGNGQPLQPQQNLSHHAITAMQCNQYINKQSSYNNFMVQGFSSDISRNEMQYATNSQHVGKPNMI